MKKIAITSGDQDGVGFEITAKALHYLGPSKSVLYFVFRSSRAEKRYLHLIAKKFRIFTVSSLEDALDLSEILTDSRLLIEIVNDESPARWVESAAQACLEGLLNSMVTAPLSKQEIRKAKMKDIGHTDILKRVSQQPQAFMCFIGKKFNVLLVTGHLPTSRVETKIDSALLKTILTLGLRSRKYLGSSRSKKPLAVLGLNPHAGDRGIIGSFEERILSPVIDKLNKDSPQIVGPLVPDVAFMPEYWNRFSFYVAQYHDQGLIPFKMIHGFDSGVHLTLGLPIKRSSVDHGTAKDLFGKNKANPRSMIEAVKWGIKLASNK